MHFLGHYISALRGCCALKFLHTLEIEQGLLAHNPRGTGVPPKNFNRENLKSGLKFSVWANTRKFIKADKPARYAFTSSPFSFHARHILPTSKFQHSYSCILLIFYRHQWTACVRTENNTGLWRTDRGTDRRTDGHSSSGYTSGLHSSLC